MSDLCGYWLQETPVLPKVMSTNVLFDSTINLNPKHINFTDTMKGQLLSPWLQPRSCSHCVSHFACLSSCRAAERMMLNCVLHLQAFTVRENHEERWGEAAFLLLTGCATITHPTRLTVTVFFPLSVISLVHNSIQWLSSQPNFFCPHLHLMTGKEGNDDISDPLIERSEPKLQLSSLLEGNTAP